MMLSRAGFEFAGRHDFSVEHHWTIRELTGHIRSTSFLPLSVLAEHAAEFSPELGPNTADGRLTDPVSFAYELPRRPGSA
ncbi:hypothetical protein ABZX30_21930 [Streptomyces sp. NPDC004542]|uniref:hypothetical protein n=1 Tax=Streptomyces sp. NPDC004542 TaxID=3154281 RepID=UPI0033BF859C